MLLSGRDRSTRDLDIVVYLEPGQLDLLKSSLRSRGFAHMDRADRHRLDGVNLYRFWLAAGDTGMSVSLDVQEGTTQFHEEVLTRAREASFGSLKLRVATTEDLILLKALAGRPIDLADARELFKMNAGELDLQYIQARGVELGLAEILGDLT